jgi:hypothetical protein
MVLAVLVTASGCAGLRSTEPDNAALLSELGFDDARTCSVVTDPAVLPAANTVVDAEMLRRQLAAHSASLAQQPRGHVLLALGYDSTGRNIRRDVIEFATPATVADTVRQAVFRTVREVAADDLPWSLRLRVDFVSPDSTALRIGRSEFCAPSPLNPGLESDIHTLRSAGIRYRRGTLERVIMVRLSVTPTGTVSGSEIVRGPPMTTDQQRRVADHVRRFSFRPATIDGTPVSGSIDIPVVLRS